MNGIKVNGVASLDDMEKQALAHIAKELETGDVEGAQLNIAKFFLTYMNERRKVDALSTPEVKPDGKPQIMGPPSVGVPAVVPPTLPPYPNKPGQG